MVKHVFEKCMYSFGVQTIQNLWVHRAVCMHVYGLTLRVAEQNELSRD
jgi:hypothetical protein